VCVLDNDQKPVADAGGDQVVVLPAPLVAVNGSKSTDDRKIVSYLWTRDRSSPAAGVCDAVHSAEYSANIWHFGCS